MREQLKRLLGCEARICESVLVQAAELLMIRDDGLYRELDCTWDEYLRERHQMSISTFKSLQASAKMYQRMATEFGVQLGNKSAARELRRIFHHDSALAKMVVFKSQQRAGKGIAITGAHVKAVEAATLTTLATGGYCDDGDGGMTAFDAQVDAEFTEILMRKKQYAIDGAKANGWSKPSLLTFREIDQLLDLTGIDCTPMGTQVEIKWRVIEPEQVLTPVTSETL